MWCYRVNHRDSSLKIVKLGVLGGTFDPPHLGHLLTATDALEHLSLDRILLVPNFVQPIKGAAQATPQDRFEMLRLLVSGDPRFEVKTLELERKGPSFSVDTLEQLSREYAGAQLFFLLGSDAFSTFREWRNPSRIMELATLAVLSRSDGSSSGAGSAAFVEAHDLPAGAITLASRIIDISSSEIRKRVRTGMPIRGFVPEAVEKYIAEKALYRQGI